ncbi:hypothetical protein Q0601_05185 [Paracoccus onubensis]|uniref:hypothetical protein n=1 Tax=Paracoccus onubensis TaxID=1675788 RepID=UPI002730C28F|nr:hypothetical protein [Paracoccus onubensis]MDP0926553.1 hypothetical protein [Paracoccus onubensis]
MRRRYAIVLIPALATWVVGSSAGGSPLLEAKLTADMTSENAAETLEGHLIGQPLSHVESLLGNLGANAVEIEDLAASRIEAGYDLGHGIRSGDSVLIVNFGLRQNWLRADRPVVAYLRYKGDRITEIISVKLSPK